MNRIRQWLEKKQREWDSLCHQCGLCCYEKGYKNGTVYIDFNKPCPYLNVETNECFVYEDRFKICKDCKKLHFHHALFASYLPKSCGYVQKYRPWVNLQRDVLRKGSRE